MKKLLIGLVLVAGVGGYLAYQNTIGRPSTAPTPTPAQSSATTISLDEVSQHNSRESCWLALDDKVYDVTPFVASGFHPGKEAILQGCGKDATELFNTRPMGSKTPHSERARKMLPQYFIGTLEK